MVSETSSSDIEARKLALYGSAGLPALSSLISALIHRTTLDSWVDLEGNIEPDATNRKSYDAFINKKLYAQAKDIVHELRNIE